MSKLERLPSGLRFRDVALTRRGMLASATMGVAGASAGLLVGCGGDDDDAVTTATATATSGSEPQPEVATIRVPRTYSGCNAPFIYAEEFLLEEGFDEVRPVVSETGYVLIDEVAAGSIDLAYMFIPELVHAIDHDVPIVILGPAHSACNKVVAADYVADLADLRGRRVGIAPLRVPQPGDFAFATSVLQRIGITPPTEVELVPVKRNDMLTVLGKDVDALFTFSPVSFSVLDSGQGHVIFDSSTDDPWSRQLCCALFAPRQFVEANPGATRKAVRAVLRALNRGASDPAAMSEAMVAKSWVVTEDYASRAVAELSFGAWRTHDLADSMRFYGLSLHEAGLISSTPEEIIQKGTDLTFFNELKEELAYAPGGVDSRFSFYCDPSESGAVTRAAGVNAARRTT